MRNARPSCQTVYAVTPNDVGRRVVSKRCNANLQIDDEGFRLESPATEAPIPSGVKSKRRRDEPPKEKIVGAIFVCVRMLLVFIPFSTRG